MKITFIRAAYILLVGLSIGSKVFANGTIVGFQDRGYFSVDVATGTYEDLGLPGILPTGGIPFPSVDALGITSNGEIFSFAESSQANSFLYNPLTKTGDFISGLLSHSFQPDDFYQSSNGLIYMIESGDITAINLEDMTANAIVSGFGYFETEIAVTGNGDIAIRNGFSLESVDVSTRFTTPFHLGIGFPLSPGQALGADLHGNFVFTPFSFGDQAIYRLDPLTSNLVRLATDFRTSGYDFIQPGPEGTLILGGRFEGLRLIDEETGDSLWHLPQTSSFFPKYAVLLSVPEPNSAALVLLALG